MLQGLPERTASEAIYLLVGTLPVEGLLHLRTLSMLGSILRQPGTTLHMLAHRQLALHTKGSWFSYCRSLCIQYDLPDLNCLLGNELTKRKWKTLTDKAVHAFWHSKLINSMQEKSTLKYLECTGTTFQPHPIWYFCEPTSRCVKASHIRAKLVSGTYPLQEHMARLNPSLPKTCPMCKLESEDTIHFILKCPQTASCRNRHLQPILSSLEQEDIQKPEDDSSLVKLILNSPSPAKSNRRAIRSSFYHSFNKMCIIKKKNLSILA